MATIIHKIFAPIKKHFPSFITTPLRSLMTIVITPIRFAWRNGFFLSAIENRAVDRRGKPLPWYTYPSIDFLSSKNFIDKSVLEFGAGQSTFWWAKKSRKVVSIEEDKSWYQKMQKNIPPNVELLYIPRVNVNTDISHLEKLLLEKKYGKFDVIIIDGFWRFESCNLAKKLLNPEGIIIADNSEIDDYKIYEAFKNDPEFQRVDFWGLAPGVVLEHCTSIFFRKDNFLFSCKDKIRAFIP